MTSRTDPAPAEEWRAIPGYEYSYEASSRGRVRSLDREVYRGDECYVTRHKGRILKTPTDRDGYPMARLSSCDGKRTSMRVSVAVALAFHGPRPHGMDVCHNNGDKLDNRPENLRYDTRRANVLDSIRHGTHISVRRTTSTRKRAQRHTQAPTPPKAA